MLKILAFIVLFLSIFRFDFILSFRGVFDAYKNTMLLSIYFFSIKIVGFKIIFKRGEKNHIYIKIGTRPYRLKLFSSQAEGKQEKSLSIGTLRDIIAKIDIRAIGIDVLLGGKNAFTSAMLMSSIKIAYCQIISYIKSKQEIKSVESFEMHYDKDELIIQLSGILRISFADIIFIITSQLNKKRRQKNR